MKLMPVFVRFAAQTLSAREAREMKETIYLNSTFVPLQTISHLYRYALKKPNVEFAFSHGASKALAEYTLERESGMVL